MKMKKKVLNRLIAYILTVVILSVSVGDAFITAGDVSTVEATGAVVIGGIAVASLAEICLMVGAVAVTLFCVGEVIDNKEEIARFGYDLINSASETVDGWILSMTDTGGQEYVYGSEALDQIRGTEWEVIQGGLPPDDDNNSDKNDGNKPVKNPMQDIWNLTSLGAVWLVDNVKKLWNRWMNGEALTEAERAVLEPVIEATCSQYDIAEQWKGVDYNYSGSGTVSYTADKTKIYSSTYKYSGTYDYPVAGYYQCETTEVVGGVIYTYRVSFCYLNNNVFSFRNLPCTITQWNNGVFGRYTGEDTNFWGQNAPNFTNFNFSYGFNFPVFSTKLAAENYLRGTGPVTDALNYAKIYREADWLSDDWAGLLIDPLCSMGLSLSQLMEIARQLGLHAIGNNLTPQELYELLKDLLAGENLGVLPGIPPSPAPLPGTAPIPDPIYLPSPDAHPIPDPGTKPGTGSDPDPDDREDPDPDPDPDSGSDMKISDYQTDLRGLFPFCIPFDFVALLNALDADPAAPCFTFPVVIPALDYREDIRLDLSVFDDVAEVIRICEKVSFLIFLMFATSKVIRW
ncbi:MAG: hypothetical protein NC489_23670 [Ruminococcus flavefaciens]|nr:hypothetical protein [Ruminococcus flavefaciens]